MLIGVISGIGLKDQCIPLSLNFSVSAIYFFYNEFHIRLRSSFLKNSKQTHEINRGPASKHSQAIIKAP